MGSGSHRLLQKSLSLLSVCCGSEAAMWEGPVPANLSIWPCCSESCARISLAPVEQSRQLQTWCQLSFPAGRRCGRCGWVTLPVAAGHFCSRGRSTEILAPGVKRKPLGKRGLRPPPLPEQKLEHVA